MSPVLLGYQQIMALLVRGEFCVKQRVVRLDGFIGSFDERTVDINGLMVKCFANGLFELSSHSRQSQDPFQIAIFVELVSDSLSPIQKNLLPRFFNLLR